MPGNNSVSVWTGRGAPRRARATHTVPTGLPGCRGPGVTGNGHGKVGTGLAHGTQGHGCHNGLTDNGVFFNKSRRHPKFPFLGLVAVCYPTIAKHGRCPGTR